jgi:DNA helicase-2/ATP-dependent DNA helicase PcrA
MDDWEVAHVFDAEFSSQGGGTPTRCEVIRRAHEAMWSTGTPTPPGYIEPSPPVNAAERTLFIAFHGTTTQTYSAVLPGEIVRLAVESIEAGLLQLREVADMSFLVVDEYQDLNPLDIRLVDLIKADGVALFAAGDDDQSIYSFRFAAPGGIQDFPVRHAGAGDHVLSGCFRCASEIVDAADTLIDRFSPAGRIPKTLESLWRTATPPTGGHVHRWRVPSGRREAELIAGSIRELIAVGVNPREIMILLSNRRLFPQIRSELIDANVPFTPPREDSWTDTDSGRFLLGMLRIISDPDDYLALRLVLGCRRGVGVGTCAAIVQTAQANFLNYRALFVDPLPAGIFRGREATALGHARRVCAAIADWDPDDLLEDREDELGRLLLHARSAAEMAPWEALLTVLPSGATLQELRTYMEADNEEQQETVLKAIFERLELPPPEGIPEPRIRVMTMHGAKGLQADVVFIPALEEQVLPGPRRAMNPGQVQEGARLLYVSMTRARAALIATFARQRFWQGAAIAPTPSRYAWHLNGPFLDRTTALDATEATAIKTTIDEMT